MELTKNEIRTFVKERGLRFSDALAFKINLNNLAQQKTKTVSDLIASRFHKLKSAVNEGSYTAHIKKSDNKTSGQKAAATRAANKAAKEPKTATQAQSRIKVHGPKIDDSKLGTLIDTWEALRDARQSLKIQLGMIEAKIKTVGETIVKKQGFLELIQSGRQTSVTVNQNLDS